MGAFAKHPHSDSNEVRLVTRKYRYTNGEVQSQIDLFTAFALTPKTRSVALNGGRVWRWFSLQRGDKEVFGVQVAYKEVMEVLVRFEGLEYIDADIMDFKEILSRIYGREDADGAHARALQFQLGGVRRHMSWREFILGISSAGDFLGTTSSYTSIRDLMLRLCHKMIAYSIARRSQAPETEICFREEAGGHDSWRLVYFKELDDTWACVALGLERQQVAVAGDAPVVRRGHLWLARSTGRAKRAVGQHRTDDASTSASQQPDP
ncbi:hypothetical protein Tco_1107512 [Tanacetum coccineum]